MQAVWDEIPAHYPGVETDAFIVMPNHVHAIVILVGAVPRDPVGAAPCGRPVGAAPRGCPYISPVIVLFFHYKFYILRGLPCWI